MNFAVFVSGLGSNLQAIMEAVKKGDIKADLVLVISDQKDAFALKRAQKAGIKPVYIDPRECSSREEFDRKAVQHLKEAKVDFIVLAGFMRILSPWFINEYQNKILNIHPSFLPDFKGTHAIRDAFKAGVKETGVTVHFVDEKVDHGPVILQKKVTVTGKDTLESLEEKIHEVEHKLYPKAISMFVSGKLN